MKKFAVLLCIGISVLIFAKSGLFSGISEKENQTVNNNDENSAVPVDYDSYTPLNYKQQLSMWFPFMDYKDILLNKSEEAFRNETELRFSNAKELGINTVYVHVRSNCDAYYNSELFPRGEYFSENSDFDPLEIMIDTAHSMGLSFHAWVNPMRGQTSEQLENMSSEYKIKQWYDDSQKNSLYIVQSGDIWYLNPAYKEVRSFIAEGILEILENYKVDGIHIDDYFYPTQDESFDRQAFEQSGSTDFSQWRLDNASLMVRQIYNTVNAVNPQILFGISPQGNIDANYTSQFADVKKWCSQKGYCDYIVPQLYYGFKNSVCPYEQTLDKWHELSSSSTLIAGVCTYKTGKEDTWAGDGINEWITDKNITARQIEYALKNNKADGIAVYSYSSTFEREDISASIMDILSEIIR